MGEPGQYRLAHSVTSIHVPSTVRSMVEARIDRLPFEDKRVLQCAAVIGEQVPGGLLEAVTDLGGDGAAGGPRPAAAGRSSSRSRPSFPSPRTGSGTRSPTTWRTAACSTTGGARCTRGCCPRSRSSTRDDLDEIVGPLAHHATHAERWAQAAHYARRAGLKSQANLSHRAAAGFFEQALAALAHLPDDDAHRGLGVDLRDEMARVLVPSGEHPRIVAILREAEVIAAGLEDHVRLARTLALLCAAYSEIGNSAGALDAGHRAVALAERMGTAESRVMATYSLGRRPPLDRRVPPRRPPAAGDPDAHRGSPARARPSGSTGAASVLARGHLAWSLAELGEFPEAVERGRGGNPPRPGRRRRVQPGSRPARAGRRPPAPGPARRRDSRARARPRPQQGRAVPVPADRGRTSA